MTTYTFNSKRVVLLDSMEMANSNFKPVETNNYNGVDPYEVTEELLAYIQHHNINTLLCYDDAYSVPSEDGTEIIYTLVKNIENKQCLTSEYVTKEYAEWDNFESSYLDTTDSYHQWTSRRQEYLDKIWDEEDLDKLRQQWDEEIEREKPKSSMYDFGQDTSFDSLLEEAE